MSTLVVIEVENGRVELVSRETLTFARAFEAPVAALVLSATVPDGVLADCAEQGVEVVYAVSGAPGAYAPAAWATAAEAALAASGADTVLAGGTPRGLEVLAHVAARRAVRMAANVTSVVAEGPLRVVRQVVGGAALEEMELPDALRVVAVAGHAVEAAPAAIPGAAALTSLDAPASEADQRAVVARVQERAGGDASALANASVVVGAGRGAGGPDGFASVDALAARLGGVVGVSRVVTSLGWRPHHEQVGQTGSRISPDVYLPCGISGAIQHWAGCQSSKVIIAVNTDPDAPMVTKATYAVIGDMHEVLPAVLTELG